MSDMKDERESFPPIEPKGGARVDAGDVGRTAGEVWLGIKLGVLLLSCGSKGKDGDKDGIDSSEAFESVEDETGSSASLMRAALKP